jgi:ppGpp synthetase/RelA/SpoT-type nucleotidyltranferase
MRAEYNLIAPIALRFTDELVHQLDRLLADQQIPLALPIQRRVKEWSSIEEKLERTAMSLSSIRELNDLIGLRTILQFRRDIERVCTAVESNLTVIKRYDTADRLKEDQFGYSSIHFVISLPEPWLAVPTLSAMKGLVAELQVRTTAQHIWATASHTLQYKKESSVPVPVRRAIHRVSALLETVDLEFERVLQERDAYRDGLPAASADEELNVDLLVQMLDESLPAANKAAGDEPYADLLEELWELGLHTSGLLRPLLNRHRRMVLQADASIVKAIADKAEGSEQYYASDPARPVRGVYFTHVGLARQALRSEFGDRWYAARERIAKRKGN